MSSLANKVEKTIEGKNITLSSARNIYENGNGTSLLKSRGYSDGAKELAKTNTLKDKKNISLLECTQEQAEGHLIKEYNNQNKQELTSVEDSKRDKYKMVYSVVAVPYVYNYKDANDTTSKPISKIGSKYACSSLVEKYPLYGYWCDENKNKLTKTNIQDKEEVYFYIQSENIKDGTLGVLTLIDKDILLHDEISSLNFTINNNEALVLIDFDKIKFNIIDLIKSEQDKEIELFVKVEIKEFKIEKELAKDKKDNLITKCGYYKIGTRSLENRNYPDNINILYPKVVHAVAEVLDYINTEPIHEQIAFIDDTNIGFTTAYAKYNEDKQEKEYGMLKTDSEMSDIPNTKLALSKYHWDNILGDEDTFKEAIYQVVNDNKYAVSQSIVQMNNNDIDKIEKLAPSKKGEEIDFTFTRIKIYTPEEGKRYSLLGANCQDFVQEVRDKYNELKKEAKAKESLS